MLTGVLTERRLVELVVRKLSHLLGVHIHDNDALVVGGEPKPVAVVHEHIPGEQVLGQTYNTQRGKETIDGIIPLLLLLTIDVVGLGRLYPIVAAVIDIESVGIVLTAAMLTDITILPHHLAALAVDSRQFTIAGGDNQQILILAEGVEPELLGEQIFVVAVLDQRLLLGLGVVAIEAVVVGLHPQILLGVDIDTVDTALDADFREYRRRIAGDSLGIGVEDAEVHALTEPQITIDVFPHVIDVVVTQ